MVSFIPDNANLHNLDFGFTQNLKPVGAAAGVFEHDDGGVGGGFVRKAEAEGSAGAFADLQQFDVFDVDLGGEERACDVSEHAGPVFGIAFGILVAELMLRLAGVSYPAFHREVEGLREWGIPHAEGWATGETRNWVKLNAEGARDRDHAVEALGQSGTGCTLGS